MLDSKNIPKVVKFLESNDFQVSERDVNAALDEKTHFSVFDNKSDFWLDVKGVYFENDENTLRRRRRIEVGKTALYVAPPEDVVVNKLLYGSEQDLRDAEGILIRQRMRL